MISHRKHLIIANLFALAFLTLLFPADAEAARTKPVQDIRDGPIPDGLDIETITIALAEACAVRNWVATSVEPGHTRCTLLIRSHMAKVDIKFDTKSYSITYADSEGLKFNQEKYKIHRNYNGWIQNLNEDITKALLRHAGYRHKY